MNIWLVDWNAEGIQMFSKYCCSVVRGEQMIEPYCSTAAKYFLFQCRLKNITEEQLKLHQFKIGSGETCSQRMATRIFQSIGWGVSDHWKNSHMWGCIDLCFRHYSSPAGWSKPASLMWSPGIAMGKLVSKKRGVPLPMPIDKDWWHLI